jgi:hypothetical protein
VTAWEEGQVRLRNYEGKPVVYREPEARDCACAYDEIYFGS